MLENAVLAQMRLDISRRGWLVWRNNLGGGVLQNGQYVRWGLANDTKAVNKSVKSGDLIGIRPVVITQEMVGSVIGQFASWEAKRPGWRFNPNDEREAAQMRWAEIVLLAGGHAVITDGALE